jgi:hypothetical protein
MGFSFVKYTMEEFKEEHTHTQVALYLVSALLKSRFIKPKEMADVCKIHQRVASRWVFYSHQSTTAINLNLLNSICELTNYPLSWLFADIENFVKNKQVAAHYNGNKMVDYSSHEYQNRYNFDIENLSKVLTYLNKNSKNTDKSDSVLLPIAKELAMYPEYLVKWKMTCYKN